MKKLKKITCAFTFLMLILSVSIIFNGCVSNKTPITANNFKTTMETKGYTISDATSQFSEIEYIEQVYLAISENNSYQIEFYEISDNTSAKAFYLNNKTIFENSKGSGDFETNLNIGNNSKYTLSGDRYKVVSRIDNTVIYLNVDIEYKDEVKTVLEDLEY